MFFVVTGGSGSGKSAFAESLVERLGGSLRIYLATMMCFDEEGKKRIERHRRMRKDKGFATREQYVSIGDAPIPEGAVVLLECMSNLVANEMFDENGSKEDCVAAVTEGISQILQRAGHLIVVTNEIFSDGVLYDQETVRYQQFLGEINRRMAAMADGVFEVVYGIPLCLKGQHLP